MKQKIITGYFCLLFSLLGVSFWIRTDSYAFENEPTLTVKIEPIETELDMGMTVQEVQPIHLASYVNLSQSERELLCAIAMAEAESEDVTGKALIMRVVLNRALATGKSIEEIIYQPNQFATGRMCVDPDDECLEALEMIIYGWDESEGALYFCSTGYNYFGDTELFQYGNHYFSK